MATDLERAVIEAARALRKTQMSAEASALFKAVDALDAGQDPEVREVGWHEVTEGDQLRSAKTGLFWEVIGVDRLIQGRRIVIRRGGNTAMITRPTEAEPMAFVKRGATGKAVDVFVEVFASGSGTV